MAVTLISAPALVSFSDCPVLFSLKTSLADKTFLTVRLLLSAKLMVNAQTQAECEFELSIPTSGGDESVTFDLSSALTAMFQYNTVEPCYANSSAVTTPGVVSYSVKYWDEYLDEDNTLVASDKVVNADTFNALPGGLSDVQRIMWEAKGYSWKAHRIFSSKPDGEVIPVDFPLVLPAYAYLPKVTDQVTLTEKLTLAGKSQSSSWTFSTRAPQWKKISFASVGTATIQLGDCPQVVVNVVESQPFATYFEFVNRHGCLESVVCYGRPSLNVSQEAERLSRVPSRAFRPTSQFMKRLSSSEQTLSLSTGPISVEWAKWFADEFFRAKQVWMLDASMGCMVPVVIEVEDESTIYSYTEPGVIDLAFSAVSGYSGFAIGSHM